LIASPAITRMLRGFRSLCSSTGATLAHFSDPRPPGTGQLDRDLHGRSTQPAAMTTCDRSSPAMNSTRCRSNRRGTGVEELRHALADGRELLLQLGAVLFGGQDFARPVGARVHHFQATCWPGMELARNTDAMPHVRSAVR
jgi:hypothetical protein